MLDGFGPFLGGLFLLFRGKWREVASGVIDEESFGSGDELSAVETVTFSLFGTYNFSTVEAIID